MGASLTEARAAGNVARGVPVTTMAMRDAEPFRHRASASIEPVSP
ncbi:MULTISPECIES: hypothetical protein [Burkholderia cepacia complex]|nr:MULTISPECIES: hypothetical protein [Burkholderia cepacia complex]